MNLSRPARIVVWSLLGITAALALCLVFLATFDWNRAKPWLAGKVSDATGRPFAIQGDLSVSWHRGRLPRSGLAAWIPWPHLAAHDISLGNPDWADNPEMLHIENLAFTLDPLPLLQRRIVLSLLRLEQPVLRLQRQQDGRNNWTFPSSEEDSRWKLELGRLQLQDGSLRVADAIKHAQLQAQLDTLAEEQEKGYGLRWTLQGKLDRAKVSGQGRAGAILSLRDDSQPYPLEAKLEVGDTRIAVAGTVTRPAELAALDMQLKLSGRSLAHLYPILGILLPETPAFATEGRLRASLAEAGGRWHYEDFTGSVGKSDLAGSISYLERGQALEQVEGKKGKKEKNEKDEEEGQERARPLLQGQLVSRQLRLEDLAPLVGANTAAPSAADPQARQERQEQPGDKVLPVQRFSTERWNTLDADIEFKGRKIVHSRWPIDDLSTRLRLKDAVLRLEPLNFGVAGGKLASTVNLDGSGQQIKARLDMKARGLALQQLLPVPPEMKASIGELNGAASLSAAGNSVAALLGSADGELKALIDHGSISKLLLEQIGLNVGGIIMTSLFGDEQVEIRCLASDFSVKQGVLQPRIFVIDTEKTVIFLKGDIDLGKEALDLTILPRNRQLQLFSLRSPLYVSGSFKHPDVGVDKGVLAAKAGGALALGALSPLAALLPLINAGKEEPSTCQPLLARARQAPQAPPAQQQKR